MYRLLLLVLAQLPHGTVPPPTGYVNDFAGVIDSAAIVRMDSLIQHVRDLTHGDIAVVTLPDLGGREAADVALQIGRQWKVGGVGDPGDQARNLGVVVLVVPRQNHQPGTGAVFIATGKGAEGFLPDARVGRIRDAMIPDLGREDYGAALETGVGLIAQAFADEFHVSVGMPVAALPVAPAHEKVPILVIVIVLVLVVIILSGIAQAAVAGMGGRSRRGGWWGGGGGWSGGSWGGGGGGGGFSGGFGGFGGGGGFSGGGAGGKF